MQCDDFCGEFDHIDVEVFEDRYCSMQDTQQAVTPSQQAKAAGLKSLSQVSEMTGQSLQTLSNWAKSKPDLFFIVLIGCKARVKQWESMDND